MPYHCHQIYEQLVNGEDKHFAMSKHVKRQVTTQEVSGSERTKNNLGIFHQIIISLCTLHGVGKLIALNRMVMIPSNE